MNARRPGAAGDPLDPPLQPVGYFPPRNPPGPGAVTIATPADTPAGWVVFRLRGTDELVAVIPGTTDADRIRAQGDQVYVPTPRGGRPPSPEAA